MPGQAPAYIPLGHRYIGAPAPPLGADLAPLFAVLADPSVAKVAHNGKEVIRAFAELGVVVEGIVEDTMLAAFLLDPTASAEPGEEVVQRLGGFTLPARTTLAGRGKTSLEGVEVERARRRGSAGSRARCLCRSRGVISCRRGSPRAGSRRCIARSSYRSRGCSRRSSASAYTSTSRTSSALSDEVGGKLAELETQIFEAAGGAFNIGSPKQLGELLFEKLGLDTKGVRRTKTGWTTEADTLETLLDAHPVIAPILEHRELSKLKGTYLDALPPLISARTGRVHTTFNQMVAATGRISSQDPNLQNIPIRSELGRKIRKAFVAAPDRVLIAADYSQIELRILAHLSGDPLLGAAFRDRVDVHTQTAAEVFSVAREDVTAEQRRIAKAVNYGLSYGQSDFGLARALGVPRTQAAEYSKRYFQRFPSIHKFMDDVVTVARAHGRGRARCSGAGGRSRI